MTFHRLANSLATRIIVIGLSILLLGNAVRYWALSGYLREDITALIAAQQLTLSNYVAREVDLKLQERTTVLSQMARTLPLGVIRQPDALQSWLETGMQHHPMFSGGLLVLDPKGKVLARSPLGGTTESASDTEVFAAIQSGAWAIGRPIAAPDPQHAVLPMSANARDAQGEVRAILVGLTAINAPGFLSFTEQDRIGKQGEIGRAHV